MPSLRHFGPTQPAERIASLDLARGLALLGIFMVNIQFMTQPLSVVYEDVRHSQGLLAALIDDGTQILFESKSYPLFSMLFGMGLVLMHDRAKAKGRPFAFVYIRRLGLLLFMGLAHAFLLWYGDILVYYACIGPVVMWLAPLKPKTMLWIAGALLAIATVWATGVNYLLLVFAGDSEIEIDGSTATGFNDFTDQLISGELNGGPETPAWAAGEIDAIKNGPFAHAVAMRAINWVAGTIFWLFGYAIAIHISAMFLFGAAILRSGVLNDPAWAKRFIKLGLFIGLPCSVLAVWISKVNGLTSPLSAFSIGITHLTGPLVSLGYLGLAMWLAQKWSNAWIVRAVSAAGRMALTNYLLQTVLVAALAQHWGLGWFGDVSRTQMVGIVLVVYVAQLIISPFWLKRFGMGPLESLWRCGTYLRWPGKRPKAA